MKVLVDTNILLRVGQPSHAQFPIAKRALETLENSRQSLRLCSQNLYEFWVVATRPLSTNGLGLTTKDAATRFDLLRAAFPALFETEQVLNLWRVLVSDLQVFGKPAHDARIAAAMLTNGISHILTFNTSDFTRFPGIAVLDPASVSNPAPGTR